jgi:hypothetical protein
MIAVPLGIAAPVMRHPEVAPLAPRQAEEAAALLADLLQGVSLLVLLRYCV